MPSAPRHRSPSVARPTRRGSGRCRSRSNARRNRSSTSPTSRSRRRRRHQVEPRQSPVTLAALETSGAGRRVIAAAIDHAHSVRHRRHRRLSHRPDLAVDDERVDARCRLLPMITFLGLLKLSYFTAFTCVGGQTIGKMAAQHPGRHRRPAAVDAAQRGAPRARRPPCRPASFGARLRARRSSAPIGVRCTTASRTRAWSRSRRPDPADPSVMRRLGAVHRHVRLYRLCAGRAWHVRLGRRAGRVLRWSAAPARPSSSS